MNEVDFPFTLRNALGKLARTDEIFVNAFDGTLTVDDIERYVLALINDDKYPISPGQISDQDAYLFSQDGTRKCILIPFFSDGEIKVTSHNNTFTDIAVFATYPKYDGDELTYALADESDPDSEMATVIGYGETITWNVKAGQVLYLDVDVDGDVTYDDYDIKFNDVELLIRKRLSSASGIYNSGKEDTDVTTVTVGGIDIGTTFGELNGLTINEVITKMLAKVILPVSKAAKITLSVDSSSADRTIYYGATLPTESDCTYSFRKAYYTLNGVDQGDYGGELDTDSVTYTVPTDTVAGLQNYTYAVSANVNAGTEYMKDSEGNNYGSPTAATTVTDTLRYNVITKGYLWFGLVSDGTPTEIPDSAYLSDRITAVTGVKAGSSSNKLSFGEEGVYLRGYVAIPAGTWSVASLVQHNANGTVSTYQAEDSAVATVIKDGIEYNIFGTVTQTLSVFSEVYFTVTGTGSIN